MENSPHTYDGTVGLLGDASYYGPVKPAVLLFRGKGIISALIRWQTRGQFSHAALLMRDGRIVESWQGVGVRVHTLNNWEGVTKFDVVGMTDEQFDVAINFALSKLGKSYDYWAIVRFISRKRMPNNDRWFCSELTVAALEHAGIKLLERIEAYEVSPGMLSHSPLLNIRSIQ